MRRVSLRAVAAAGLGALAWGFVAGAIAGCRAPGPVPVEIGPECVSVADACAESFSGFEEHAHALGCGYPLTMCPVERPIAPDVLMRCEARIYAATNCLDLDRERTQCATFRCD